MDSSVLSIKLNQIIVSLEVESLLMNGLIEGALYAALRKLDSDLGLRNRTTLTPTRSPSLEVCNAHTKPMSWHFYRAVYC